MALVDTGQGWAAEEDFLVYSAGTVIATSTYAGFAYRWIKLNDGYAIPFVGYTHDPLSRFDSNDSAFLVTDNEHSSAAEVMRQVNINGEWKPNTLRDGSGTFTRSEYGTERTIKMYWCTRGAHYYQDAQVIPGFHTIDLHSYGFTAIANLCQYALNEASFTILDSSKIPISTCSVGLNPITFVYDGTEKQPLANVAYADFSTTPPTIITLIQGRDYLLSYANNINPSNVAEAIIKGIGNYYGTRTEYFSIVQPEYSIFNATIVYDKGPFNYTGQAIEPRVLVYDERGLLLYEDSDYTVTYQNNINPGTATVTIRGIGRYTGFQSLPFYIVKSTESPFIDGGTTEPGGGDGDNDYTTTPITPGSLPFLSPANSGLTRIYIPTIAQLSALGQYLWYTDSVWETVWNHVKEMVGSLSEAIIGLNFIPVPVETGPVEEVRVLLNNTGVYMPPALSQWVEVDCGTCQVTTQAGSFLDYSPYTSVELFLPFIGSVQLDTDEVMGKTLHVVYHFDIVSGACTARVEVNGDVFYQYSGQAAIACPVTSANFSEYISAAIGVAGTAIGAMTGGVIGAALGGGIAGALTRTSVSVQNTSGGSSVTTSSTDMVRYGRNPATGRMRQENKMQGFSRTETNVADTDTVRTTRYAPSKAQQASFIGLGPGQIANTVGSVISSKPHVSHSGAFSGNSGFLGERKCFLTIKRPKQALPEHYAEVCGYPCMIWKNLNELIGFTKMNEILLKDIPATQNELDEILSFLKSGVIL